MNTNKQPVEGSQGSDECNENKDQIGAKKLNASNCVGARNLKLSEKIEGAAFKLLGPIYSTDQTYPEHNLAKRYTMGSGKKREALKALILAVGQIAPILLHNGLIVDGRLRQTVMVEAGIKRNVQEFLGNENALNDYVCSLHVGRRLNPSQAAVEALSYLDEAKKAAKIRQGKKVEFLSSGNGRAMELVGVLLGTNHSYIHSAEKIQREAPELLWFIMENKINISTARKILKEFSAQEDRDEFIHRLQAGEKIKKIMDDMKKEDPIIESKQEKIDIKFIGAIDKSVVEGVKKFLIKTYNFKGENVEVTIADVVA